MDIRKMFLTLKPNNIFDLIDFFQLNIKENIDELCSTYWSADYNFFRNKYTNSWLSFINNLDFCKQNLVYRHFGKYNKFENYIAHQFMLHVANNIPLSVYSNMLGVECPKTNNYSFFEENFSKLDYDKKLELFNQYIKNNDNDKFYMLVKIYI